MCVTRWGIPLTRWGHSPYKMGNIFPYELNKFLSVLLTEMKNWPGLPRILWGGPPARFFFRLESVACKSLKLIPFTSGVPGTAQIKRFNLLRHCFNRWLLLNLAHFKSVFSIRRWVFFLLLCNQCWEGSCWEIIAMIFDDTFWQTWQKVSSFTSLRSMLRKDWVVEKSC